MDFHFISIIDSGADSSIFPAEFGEAIGIDIKSVKPKIGTGSGGKSNIYYHQVDVHFEMENELYKLNCYAGFSWELADIGLLGREDFFRLFEEVTFNQTAETITLKNIIQLPEHKGNPY